MFLPSSGQLFTAVESMVFIMRTVNQGPSWPLDLIMMKKSVQALILIKVLICGGFFSPELRMPPG